MEILSNSYHIPMYPHTNREDLREFYTSSSHLEDWTRNNGQIFTREISIDIGCPPFDCADLDSVENLTPLTSVTSIPSNFEYDRSYIHSSQSNVDSICDPNLQIHSWNPGINIAPPADVCNPIVKLESKCVEEDASLKLLDILLSDTINSNNYEKVLNQFQQVSSQVDLSATADDLVSLKSEVEASCRNHANNQPSTSYQDTSKADMERERRNAASRKSRLNKKKNIKMSEALVDQLFAENHRLEIFLKEVTIAVDKCKEILVKHLKSNSDKPKATFQNDSTTNLNQS